MSTRAVFSEPEPIIAGAIASPRSQNFAAIPRRPRRSLQTAGLATLVFFVGACGSSLQPHPDGGPGSCDDIQQAYADALIKAQECTVGAAEQCSVQVWAGFWCYCTTWANGGADTLTAIASQYQAAGCQSVCNGTCVQLQSLTCLADTTSPTGGRCQVPALLNLDAANDGGEFAVPVGYEIDIVLQAIGPNDYDTNVVLSFDATTVLEITISAGPPNPAGPIRLYRLRAVSPGQVVVQIPRTDRLSDASSPAAFMITLDIS
jgi:hypothetical protein